MSTRHETNHKVWWCYFITQFMLQDWFKCLRKKEEIGSVFICNCKAEEAEKSFSSDWAENLAESNQGFLLSPHQHLVQGDQTFPKITVEEPLEDLESENIETWQKLQRKKTMQQIRDLSFLSRKR